MRRPVRMAPCQIDTEQVELTADASACDVPYTNLMIRNYRPFIRADLAKTEQLPSSSNYE
jgi:hypothetical protein